MIRIAHFTNGCITSLAYTPDLSGRQSDCSIHTLFVGSTINIYYNASPQFYFAVPEEINIRIYSRR